MSWSQGKVVMATLREIGLTSEQVEPQPHSEKESRAMGRGNEVGLNLKR